MASMIGWQKLHQGMARPRFNHNFLAIGKVLTSVTHSHSTAGGAEKQMCEKFVICEPRMLLTWACILNATYAPCIELHSYPC